MNEFLQIALSYPTVIFSGLLVCVFMYWIMVILGALDLDLVDVDLDMDSDIDVDLDMDMDMDVDADMDVDVDPDIDVDADADMDVDAPGGGILHAAMATIGLGTVPVTIIGSILTLIAWFLCFTAVNYLGPIIGTGVFVGLGVIVGSFLLGLPITSIFTHPLKGIFEVSTRTRGHTVVGKVCKVTSGRVSETFGQGAIDDGGAGVLISIRYADEGVINRGTRVLIIEYDEAEDVYWVEPYDDMLSDDRDTYETVLDEPADAEEEQIEEESKQEIQQT